MMQFQKATKTQARLRLALDGPSGSGKTYTMLRVATALGARVAVIDTERGSASKYADEFSFDALNLESFHPQTYIDAIHAAEASGYDVLGIDSLSHAWFGREGALELVDREAKKSKSGNSFTAWREVTPLHNALVDAILRANLHVIATMRTKTEYALSTNERGQIIPKKIGTAPVQRDGMEYEFDVVGDMDLEHNLIVAKTRCRALDGQVIAKPGAELANTLKQWLTDGAPVPPQQQRAQRIELLRGLRKQEAELLNRRGEKQTPIPAERAKEMSDDEIETLIARTQSNIVDLKAAQDSPF